MKTQIAVLAALFLSIHAAYAARWECQMPGGIYVINTVHLVSISTHEYVLNAAARVTELTIGTTSAVVARFYYIEPLVATDSGPSARVGALLDRVQEKAGAIADRVGQEQLWRKVVKDYPATTHAHTVEYRVDTKENIQTLFNSLNNCWRLNSNTVVKVNIAASE